MTTTEGVACFLSSIGMQDYLMQFQIKGYDDESDIPYLRASDLQLIGISDSLEVSVILHAAAAFKESPEHKLTNWLQRHGLSHYYEGFVQSEMTLLKDIAKLQLPDEEMYDVLEVTLPGHRRRLERAVQSLRSKLCEEENCVQSEVVAEGWWGFPVYLPLARFPFLLLQGIIKSTCHTSKTKFLDFMVDSGSDVSTLRETVVRDLNLKPVTTVRSCGAYGSQLTTMYHALVTIGNTDLVIEVISSSYDSLGSCVLRKFCHHIDDKRHRWFHMNDAGSTSSMVTPVSSSHSSSTKSHLPITADTTNDLQTLHPSCRPLSPRIPPSPSVSMPCSTSLLTCHPTTLQTSFPGSCYSTPHKSISSSDPVVSRTSVSTQDYFAMSTLVPSSDTSYQSVPASCCPTSWTSLSSRDSMLTHASVASLNPSDLRTSVRVSQPSVSSFCSRPHNHQLN